MIKKNRGAYILFLNTLQHGEIFTSDKNIQSYSFVLGEKGVNGVQIQQFMYVTHWEKYAESEAHMLMMKRVHRCM